MVLKFSICYIVEKSSQIQNYLHSSISHQHINSVRQGNVSHYSSPSLQYLGLCLEKVVCQILFLFVFAKLTTELPLVEHNSCISCFIFSSLLYISSHKINGQKKKTENEIMNTKKISFLYISVTKNYSHLGKLTLSPQHW